MSANQSPSLHHRLRRLKAALLALSFTLAGILLTMLNAWLFPLQLDDLACTSLGLRLQRARIGKGFSQEALAHAAGISTYTYQKFEKGESRPSTPMNPRLRTLIALANALDMRVEELVGRMV